MKLEIDLTMQQERFLELFAINHQAYSQENLGTRKPIHIVMNTVKKYIPYNENYFKKA